MLTWSPERHTLPTRERRVLGAVSLLAALLACPACSHPACAGPADLPPSVFVHADALLERNPGTRVRVCATDCITFTGNDDAGQLGPQLVIASGDDHTPIELQATVRRPHRQPVISSLTVHLSKETTTGICGSHVSYATSVHLDSTGELRQGPS